MKRQLKYQYYSHLEEDKFLNQIWELLCKYDYEFIPPLSVREHTNQTTLNGLEIGNGKPRAYYEELIKQAFILCIEDKDKVLGFMSMKEEFTMNELQSILGDRRNSYVSTLIVEQENRGKGIASSLYDYLENKLPVGKKPEAISTRTWSRNDAHITILKKKGFTEALRIVNDRGRGMDTVYYCKILKRE